MAAPLPGKAIPAVGAATPPRPDEERPPQLPARAKAALTFLKSAAVFRVPTAEGELHLRFFGDSHRILVVGAQAS